MTKPKLIFTRGLPASGKTTWAKDFIRGQEDSWARINRDDFRLMLHDGVYLKGSTENQILIARDATMTGLLRRGVSVVNDDTNLPQRMARDLRSLAERCGADWEVKDFTHVSLETCIERDYNRFMLGRGPYVTETVIRDMHTRFLKGKELPLPLPSDADAKTDAEALVPYVRNELLTPAIIVDIDGTVALRGARGWYEEDKIHLDRPNRNVVDAVRIYARRGYEVLFVSGRSMDCYDTTLEWLQRWVLSDAVHLWMRPSGDMRQDAIVKAELFDKHIRHVYNISAVFDDRNQVVEMWRALGLTVFQVAEGDF